jgi:hypothetical protein
MSDPVRIQQRAAEFQTMRTARQTADAVRQLETLGRLGCMVSVACGPSGGGPCGWSVLVAMPDGRVFEEPYAATDFADAVAIAEREVTRRRGVLSRMLPDGQLGGLGAADPLAPLLPVRVMSGVSGSIATRCPLADIGLSARGRR